MRKMEEENNYMEEWRWRNNTFILGIEEFQYFTVDFSVQ